MTDQSLSTNTQMIMVSTQLGFYLLAGLVCAHKLFTTCQSREYIYLPVLYLLIMVNIGLEIAILIYELITLTVYQKNPNINIIAGANVFCIAMATLVMLILSGYWRRLRYDFSSSIAEQDEGKQSQFSSGFKLKTMILGLWVLIYLAYFIYFLVVQGRETTFIQEIAIYAIAQGVAGCLYLCAILTELRRGIFLWSDLNKYEKILTGVQLNKTRFLLIFWTVTLVSLARCAFIIFLMVEGIFKAKAQSSQELQYKAWLWYGLYAYTFSALIPISIFLLGFVDQHTEAMTENQSSSKGKILGNGESKRRQSSNKNSSSQHQTELSQDI